MLSLTPRLRALLKKPLGKIISGAKALSLARKGGAFAAVGDSTIFFFLKNKEKPALAIFDFVVQRKKAPAKIKAAISRNFPLAKKIKNRAGTIAKKAMDEIARLSAKRGAQAKKEKACAAIQIIGEEDLLALPAIKYAPANSYVFYGQPKKGIVAVRAGSKAKKRAERILQGMGKETPKG